MQMRIGTYYFPVNGVNLDVEYVPKATSANVRYANEIQWTISGYLLADVSDSQDTITALENLFKENILDNYFDAALYNDDGTLSSEILPNDISYTGVRVIRGPRFAGTMGAEMGTARHFQFTIAAEYAISVVGPLIMEFEEHVSLSGGGPLLMASPAVNGPPQIQTIYSQMPYMASQQGRAVGFYAYPVAVPPIWPSALAKYPEVVRKNPKLMGQGYMAYEITWRYDFLSASVLIGVPNLQPIYAGR